ncbi:TEL2 [Sanghuangporus sanghuang]
MSPDSRKDASVQIREMIARLQSPVSDISELLSLLSGPLDIIGLLPPVFRKFSNSDLSSAVRDVFQIAKHIPPIQNAILESIAPTWEKTLQEQGYNSILYQYFSPDTFSSSFRASGDVALLAYTYVLSLPLTQFSVEVLQRLARQYPIDRLHSVVYSRGSSVPPHKKSLTWEEVVQCVVSLPVKVANKSDVLEIPPGLEPREYYSSLCTRFEILVASFDLPLDSEIISSMSFLLTKLVNVGLFPSTTSLSPSQTSFPSVTLSTIRSHIASFSGGTQESYICVWRDVFASLPMSLFCKALASFVAHLTELPDDLDSSNESRSLVKREALLLSRILGNLEGEEDEKWLSISSTFLVRSWSIAKARILVCWATISDEEAIPPHARDTLINQIMEVWSSEEHIKHSLLSHHQYLTTALLLAIHSLPTSHPAIQSLAFSGAFIGAVSLYISHLDPCVRRCGMLAAEFLAERTNTKLDFKQWEGEGEGREWARTVRTLVKKRDADVEEAAADVLRLEPMDVDEQRMESRGEEPVSSFVVTRVQLSETAHDSDDDLEGYAVSPTSSRSPSPTSSELEEIERDPTINVGKKKTPRPVYLFDLAQLITSSKKPDDPENADRIQMALDCAEELIRRKKNFGFELEENAVNLVYVFVGLQNNYELEGFDEKRQAAVHALVACCPRKAAPAIIDEFLKNQYSTDQRFVMLNALALGARELASLPIPPLKVAPERTAFPSKQLPRALHKKYIAYDERNGGQVQRMLEDISQKAIESGKNAAEAKTAPIVRERQLRIKQPMRIAEVSPGAPYVPKESNFSELAAEYFIGPLVGKFWLFLRDEQEREARTVHRKTAYRGTGTGLILSPMVLAHFLGTVAVLMHAARHSPAFLAVLAPDTLELAVTLGTRPMSGAEEDKEREAAVLTAALELAVVVLDGCLELDGGRSLCLEHSALLLGSGEWAGEVLGALERGLRVPGEGGAHEMKLRRAAAGVVLKVDELTARWRQSMISLY